MCRRQVAEELLRMPSVPARVIYSTLFFALAMILVAVARPAESPTYEIPELAKPKIGRP